MHSFLEIFVVGKCYFIRFSGIVGTITVFPEKHRNNSLKIVMKNSILSLFTKFHPLVFQLRQKEKFSMLGCEIGF